MSKQVLLFRDGAKLTAEDLRLLREAGIVPIKVAKFEDVRIVDPYTANTANEVWLSAFEALAQSTSASTKELFGGLLAQKLSQCAPAHHKQSHALVATPRKPAALAKLPEPEVGHCPRTDP